MHSRSQVKALEADRQAQGPQLHLYLNDAFVRRPAATRGRLYVFAVSVTNSSSTDNALVRAELQLQYLTDIGSVVTLRAQSSSGDGDGQSIPLQASTTLPLNLPARSAATCTFSFKLDEAVLGTARVLREDLVLTDAHGIETTAQCILRELVDDVS